MLGNSAAPSVLIQLAHPVCTDSRSSAATFTSEPWRTGRPCPRSNRHFWSSSSLCWWPPRPHPAFAAIFPSPKIDKNIYLFRQGFFSSNYRKYNLIINYIIMYEEDFKLICAHQVHAADWAASYVHSSPNGSMANDWSQNWIQLTKMVNLINNLISNHAVSGN